MKQLPGSVKRAVRRVMHFVAWALNGISGGRITPNGVTWVGFLMHIPIALLIAKGEFVWGAVFLVVFGLFDTLDGELARLQGRVTNNGGFLDAATDRLKEVLLYSGAAWYLAQGAHPQYAALAVAACGASICVSFVKAKGEAIVASSGKQIPYPELNRMFSGGLFPFEVRMLVLLIGLLADQLVWAVAAVALFSAITVFQRLFVISRRIS
jgi:CDP-diacylglycerol--glycerol-3-phosphate 3-phosphatidyltransferase